MGIRCFRSRRNPLAEINIDLTLFTLEGPKGSMATSCAILFLTKSSFDGKCTDATLVVLSRYIADDATPGRRRDGPLSHGRCSSVGGRRVSSFPVEFNFHASVIEALPPLPPGYADCGSVGGARYSLSSSRYRRQFTTRSSRATCLSDPRTRVTCPRNLLR